LPFNAVFAILANSSDVIAKSEPGEPTWPKRSVIVCAQVDWMLRIGKVRTKAATNLHFMVFFLLAARSGAYR